MWDAILSVHLNPLTCGVAKFNHELGRRLGIRVEPLDEFTADAHAYPLVSVHPREVVLWPGSLDRYDLFLHSIPSSMIDWRVVRAAAHVYVGNDELANLCAAHSIEATALWAPSLLIPLSPYASITVFTFGMAHKFEAQYFERLKALLEAVPPGLLNANLYAIRVSTGIHEGTPWDETFTQNLDVMGRIFGPRVQSLGFISDMLVTEQFHLCDAVALFYPGGAQANNTTLWAAMEAGCTVITNLGSHSPPELVHGQTCYDINRLTSWPLPLTCRVVREAVTGRSWERLIEQFQAVTA